MLKTGCGTGSGLAVMQVKPGRKRSKSPELPDFLSFRQQERIFAGLNLVLLVFLCAAQFVWAKYLGTPHRQVLSLLGLGIVANLSELVWLNRRKELSSPAVLRLTWTMIAIHLAIAFGIASYSYKSDVQYFALMIPAILQAAFRFSRIATALTVLISDGLIFFWVWHYFRIHPPVDPNSYIEAGTVSLIYAIMGFLVWALVDHLRKKEGELTASLDELERTEAKLLEEGKLAAVGRFSSAIAHEIRNPVAMISSALATAANRAPGSEENREMYDIATKEAARLERLTTDFLTYARPRTPAVSLSDVADSIGYIADICRPRAAANNIQVYCQCDGPLQAKIDSGQLQQALLNLAMNAVEASPPGGSVFMRGRRDGAQIIIEVENGNGPIPAATVPYIFEPFFTTKSSGTGLGMGIARNIAIAHGGDIVLAQNDAQVIRFNLSLPAGTGRREETV